MSPIVPVILSGGNGTRLWPRSRPEQPKPFLPLLGEETLFQQALRRCGGAAFAPALVVTGAAHLPHVEALGDDLWGVRLDTSDKLADKSLQERHGDDAPTGVAAELVELTRSELDKHGFPDVKIVVSGGFTVDRITAFEDAGVPVDSYGVGSSLLRGANDFTADVVMNEGRPCAKVGRGVRPNDRLETVK